MTMIEKVSKAINLKCRERGYSPIPDYAIAHIACAAIQAMREPTEGMIKAYKNAYQDSSYISHHAYQAMIDAALKE